jgi:hypothetical protein
MIDDWPVVTPMKKSVGAEQGLKVSLPVVTDLPFLNKATGVVHRVPGL